MPVLFGAIFWLPGRTIEFFEAGASIGIFLSLFIGGSVGIPALWNLGIKFLLRDPHRRAFIRSAVNFVGRCVDPVFDVVADAYDGAGRIFEVSVGPLIDGIPELLVYLLIGWMLYPLFAHCSCGFLLFLLLMGA